jgi:hypothetical protein
MVAASSSDFLLSRESSDVSRPVADILRLDERPEEIL